MQDTPSGNGTFSEASGAAATPSSISAPVPLSDRTMSALRQRFGVAVDAKIADARALVDQAASRWPDAQRLIDCAGLADSPHLIACLAARAAWRREPPSPHKVSYRRRSQGEGGPADTYHSIITGPRVPPRHPSRSMNGDSDGHGY